MTRRSFIQASSVALLGGCARWPRPTGSEVMTVAGPLPADRLGRTLTHEHVLVDFAPADVVSPDRYSQDEAFALVLPHLQRIRALGCDTLIEFTPDYLGRDPVLLRRLSEASGLHILTNTGLYGARDDQHLPPYVATDTVDALAARWVAEWRDGIGGTGIRPGFMKIGVDGGPLSATDATLVRAAARAHLATGLTLAVHTGPAEAAFQQLDILSEEGVHPSAWVWTHAQAEEDPARHVEAARLGGWVALDGIGPDSLGRHVALVVNLRDAGLLGRVLVSQDAGWYRVGEPGGAPERFRGYDFFFTDFLPALQAAGLSDDELEGLVVANPREAFSLGVRAA